MPERTSAKASAPSPYLAAIFQAPVRSEHRLRQRPAVEPGTFHLQLYGELIQPPFQNVAEARVVDQTRRFAQQSRGVVARLAHDSLPAAISGMSRKVCAPARSKQSAPETFRTVSTASLMRKYVSTAPTVPVAGEPKG